MTHLSECSKKLILNTIEINNVEQLKKIDKFNSDVYLFWLPFPRTNTDAIKSKNIFEVIKSYCAQLSNKSTICFLTTPPDAAVLLAHLEYALNFKLWVAVKTSADTDSTEKKVLSKRHATLLVLAKYSEALIHTKTRIKYTCCPACQKTTKDYGGKKHTYHEYGTLMSDVWRDIEINPNANINVLIDRVSEIFGIEEYQNIWLINMQRFEELLPVKSENKEVQFTREKLIKVENKSFKNQLLNEDCLSALRSLPDNCIDFCFADPPYNLNKKYDKWDDALESIEYFKWCDSWLSELYRVLKPGHTLAVLNIPLLAARYYNNLNSFMIFQDWIVWDALSFPVRMIMPAHYAILCFSKGEPRPLPGLIDENKTTNDKLLLNPLAEFYCIRPNCIKKRNRFGNIDRSLISNIWYDIHRLKHNSRRVDHPCQLPPDLMKRLFAVYTKSDEIILDCFNGAGTSTLTAHQMGRRFVGIELSQQYYEISLKRHEQLEKGIDPFGKINEIPQVKNSNVPRLPKQKYKVSKKVLQLEIKRIAKDIGRIPTKDEVKKLSEYSIEYFENYFISWGEACAAARTTGMTEIQT
ncbi:site-specific DNA-methyltransferase [Komarekiella sp. 'clone 1']|uniref:Site-specific DNA-methyltransferase n=1 Tax=Komarekiella delphini-convector SJRDD-AB1 TaxID=2593771 RepID=A0AA40VTC6_9NOST|nr:DNA methyltransferase [Komarekiella delphini-convector]MBD6619062.1 site-specific DNA-methyltransferase [Komarekiella delphini-convector SJRDD-AB1]